MELRHLRYFVAAAEAGHFRRAAALLNIAQPALSRQIRALEEELEVALFDRLPRGVRLSSAGQAFLDDAKRIIDEAEQAAERARRVARGQVGTLRLACSEPASAHDAVTATIRSFRSSEPQVELMLLHMVSSQQLLALRANQIDAGFVYRSANSEEEFAHREVDVVDVLVALPQSHPLAAAGRLRLAQLRDQPLICIARRINAHFYDSLMAACAKGGLVPHVIQEANSGIVLSLVSVGMGVGIISSAMRSRAPQGVVLKTVDDLSIPSCLDLIWRRDSASPVLQRFVAEVAEISDRLRRSDRLRA
jgi:DNA-binding transcriptional LysR family regulator